MSRASRVDALKRGIGTAAPAPKPSDAPVPAETPRRPRREKPVRFTLDLEPADHRWLKEYALGADAKAAAVMRAVLAELRDDPELAARVKARIWHE